MKELLGNEKAQKLLQKIIKNGKVSHAYLFCGPEGVGKKLFALNFAKTLNCETGGITPCNKCNSCNKASKMLHPDIRLLTTESKQIKIELIKEASSFILSPPFEGKYRVIIIDDAHKMNPKASNAVLKTLEEPAANSVIILVTGLIKNLLPTIVSRCLKINFAPLEESIIEKILLQDGYEPSKIKDVLPFCDGSVKKGEEFLSPENLETIELIKEFINDLTDKSFSQICNLAEEIVNKNKEEMFFSVLTAYINIHFVNIVAESGFRNRQIINYISMLEKAINFAKLLRYNITRSFIIETLLISIKLREEL